MLLIDIQDAQSGPKLDTAQAIEGSCIDIAKKAVGVTLFKYISCDFAVWFLSNQIHCTLVI